MHTFWNVNVLEFSYCTVRQLLRQSYKDAYSDNDCSMEIYLRQQF